MELVSESHEGWSLEFNEIRFVRVRQIFDESADIGAGVRVRWAKTVIVRIAERVACDGARMKHAEPSVVETNSPARHAESACVPPAHELPQNVSAVPNDIGELGLDREPLPAPTGRVEIDRSVLGKISFSLRASRLKESPGVIGAGQADAVQARAIAQFA